MVAIQKLQQKEISEVITAVTMNIAVFWYATPCGLVNILQVSRE
jgi:hypothetical protein